MSYDIGSIPWGEHTLHIRSYIICSCSDPIWQVPIFSVVIVRLDLSYHFLLPLFFPIFKRLHRYAATAHFTLMSTLIIIIFEPQDGKIDCVTHSTVIATECIIHWKTKVSRTAASLTSPVFPPWPPSRVTSNIQYLFDINIFHHTSKYHLQASS